jgi:hypothetical protein
MSAPLAAAAAAAALAAVTAEAPFHGAFLYGSRARPDASPRPDSDWDLWAFVDSVTTDLRPCFRPLGDVSLYIEEPGGWLRVGGVEFKAKIVNLLVDDRIDLGVTVCEASALEASGPVIAPHNFVRSMFERGVKILADPTGQVARWVENAERHGVSSTLDAPSDAELVSEFSAAEGALWKVLRGARKGGHALRLMPALDRLHATLRPVVVRAGVERARSLELEIDIDPARRDARLKDLLEEHLDTSLPPAWAQLLAQTYGPCERDTLRAAGRAGLTLFEAALMTFASRPALAPLRADLAALKRWLES